MSLTSELFYIILILVMLIHCIKYHGKIYAIRIFGIGFIMGLIIENSGVLQGSYTEWGYLIYVPGSLVPIITQIGWILVTYACISLGEKIFEAWPILKKNSIIMALFISLIATFWDILIDPYSCVQGSWVWTEQAWGPHRYGWLDVPIINWIAWFWCMFGWALSTFYIDSKKLKWSGKKQILAQFGAIFVTEIILLIGAQLSFFLIEGVWLPIWNPPLILTNYPWKEMYS